MFLRVGKNHNVGGSAFFTSWPPHGRFMSMYLSQEEAHKNLTRNLRRTERPIQDIIRVQKKSRNQAFTPLGLRLYPLLLQALLWELSLPPLRRTPLLRASLPGTCHTCSGHGAGCGVPSPPGGGPRRRSSDENMRAEATTSEFAKNEWIDL